MHSVHLNAITRPDGTVVLTVPTGERGGQAVEVEVRIRSAPRVKSSRREWEAWVRKLSGSIQDPSFKRPDQPPVDDVEPLS